MHGAEPFAVLPYASADQASALPAPDAFPAALIPQAASSWAPSAAVWVARRSTNGRARPVRLGPDVAAGRRQYLCTDAERVQLRAYLESRRPPVTFDLPVPEAGGAVEVTLAGEPLIEPLAGDRYLVSFDARAAKRAP